MSEKARRVEYLARVRYTNELPPPPFAPRPVKFDIPTADLLSAGSVSAIFLQRGLAPETDVELGMPLDLSVLDGAFDIETAEETMCPPAVADSELDKEDQALLAAPQTSGVSQQTARSFAQAAGSEAVSSDVATRSSEIGMGTSFLRRTAYMSGETRRAAKRKAAVKLSENDKAESRAQVEIRQIEAGFEAVKQPVSELKHPSKPHLKAVGSKPLFPDSKDSDLNFTEIKMLGSAALGTLPRTFTSEELQASVFYRSAVNVGAEVPYEWISFLTPESEEESEKLNRWRTDLRDILPAEEAQAEEEAVFPLAKMQDSEFSVLPYKEQFKETVITQGETAYYCVPVSKRYNLRRRRLPPHLQARIRSEEFDVLDLGLRELSPNETIQRDEVRSIYDPVNYG